MVDIKPEAKKKLEEAYKRFESSLREIAREHRTTVGELFQVADKAALKNIKREIDAKAE